MQQKLVIAGLAKDGTGLTSVMDALINELKSSWEILVFGFDNLDGNYQKQDGVTTITSISHDDSFRTQEYFRNTLHRFNPEAILIIGQPWKMSDFIKVAINYKPAKVAVYMPIEGFPDIDFIAPYLRGLDICITYTDYVKEAFCQKIKNGITTFKHIGHGTDPFYKPLSQDSMLTEKIKRQQWRKELFPDTSALWNGPILLNSNCQYWRKRLDLTIEAFSLSKHKKEAKLYLNISGLSSYERGRIEKIIIKHNLSDSVFVNVLNKYAKSISKKDLLQLYSACDIGITTSMGEGWGLGVFEHAATGAAQIVPNHTSFAENWPGETALKFKSDIPIYIEHEATEMYAADPKDIANEIDRLINKPDLISHYGTNAFRHVQKPQFKWSKIGEQFDAVLRSMINKPTDVLV